MSETKIEYLQGEREAEIRKHLRDETLWELLDRIRFEDQKFKDIVIEYIIENNLMEVEE